MCKPTADVRMLVIGYRFESVRFSYLKESVRWVASSPSPFVLSPRFFGEGNIIVAVDGAQQAWVVTVSGEPPDNPIIRAVPFDTVDAAVVAVQLGFTPEEI